MIIRNSKLFTCLAV